MQLSRSCGGYLHDDFCGVQDKNKRYLKNIAIMTDMCQKCAANIGETELTYKIPIYTEDGYSDSKEEEEMSNFTRQSLLLSIRSISPPPVRKKKRTSSVGGKKKPITVHT